MKYLKYLAILFLGVLLTGTTYVYAIVPVLNTNAGKVAIGTTTTFARLSIQQGFGTTTPLFDIASTTSSNYATSSLFRVNANGNIGIGTSSPYALESLQASTGDIFVTATSTKNPTHGFDSDGHEFTSGYAGAVSTCGTGTGTVVGDDQSGTITTATAATACTYTFAKAYRNTPVCTVTDDSLVGFADINSVSTTAVTFGISSALTGGHLYYRCSYHQ